MAYDEDLAERVRELLRDEPDLKEKRMFGGMGFLLGGNLAVAASGQGGLLVRVDPDDCEDLIAAGGGSPMQMRGRDVAGWVRVGSQALEARADLERWVEAGVGRVRGLEAK